jgi:uncharacterized membrane protein
MRSGWQTRERSSCAKTPASAMREKATMRQKMLLSGALAVVFGVSGVVHLVAPGVYRPIMPQWLPAPLALIYISGVCELLGALGLLAPRVAPVRGLTRYGLVALLFAVFPANVQMAFNGFTQGASPLALSLEVARLPLQWVLIMAVLAATEAPRLPHSATPAQPTVNG